MTKSATDPRAYTLRCACGWSKLQSGRPLKLCPQCREALNHGKERLLAVSEPMPVQPGRNVILADITPAYDFDPDPEAA